MSVLASITAPVPARIFLESHWPHAAFESHGDPRRLPAFFQQRVLQSAADLATVYLGRISIVRGQANSDSLELPSNTNPLSPLGMGLTVQFRDLRPYVPGTSELISAFAAELGIDERAVSLSAYASPPGDGFSLHYDPGEIFSIQLQGRKVFQHAPMREIRNPYGAPWGPGAAVFDDLCFQVGPRFPDPAQVTLNRTDMRPGSVLFLPRGTWHCTEASGEPSFSISIAVQPLSACTLLLSRLRTLLLQDADWRAPIYGAGGGASAEEAALRRSADLLARLAPIIAQIEPKDLVGCADSAYSTTSSVNAATRFLREPRANLCLEGIDAADGLAMVKIWHGTTQASGTISLRVKVAPAQIPVFEWLDRQAGAFDAGAVREAITGVSWPEIQKLLDLAVRGQLVRRLAFRTLKQPVPAHGG